MRSELTAQSETESNAGAVERDGYCLNWVREGAGIPMLVVGSRRYYPRVFPPSLREHFEIVFCDLRHFAPNPEPRPDARVSRDLYSDDIEAVRRAAGLDRPVVVGHSIHAAIAIEYARRNPQAVRGVVAIAGALPSGDVGQFMQAAADFFPNDAGPARLAAHERNLATRRVPEQIESSQDFIDAYVSTDAMKWYDVDFDSSDLWKGVEIDVSVFAQLSSPDAYPVGDLEPIDVPVFLALGRYDYGLPYFLWDDAARQQWPNLRLRLYEKSAHTPQYEQPEEFTADVADWAASL